MSYSGNTWCINRPFSQLSPIHCSEGNLVCPGDHNDLLLLTGYWITIALVLPNCIVGVEYSRSQCPRFQVVAWARIPHNYIAPLLFLLINRIMDLRSFCLVQNKFQRLALVRCHKVQSSYLLSTIFAMAHWQTCMPHVHFPFLSQAWQYYLHTYRFDMCEGSRLRRAFSSLCCPGSHPSKGRAWTVPKWWLN